MSGRLDVDCTPELLGALIDDASRLGCGTLVFELDLVPTPVPEEAGDKVPLLNVAENLQVFMVRQSGTFVRDVRAVCWVKSGSAEACAFVLTFPEIYMHPKGTIGGFECAADRRSAHGKHGHSRVSHLYAAPIVGGYSPLLLEAMLLRDFPMSYAVGPEGVKFFDRRPALPGEQLLTEGLLTLDAPTALRLGVSKGTVSTLDELVAALDPEKKHALRVVRGRSEATLGEWTARRDKAAAEVDELLGRMNKAEARDDRPERAGARAERRRLIEQLIEVYRSNRDVLPVGALRERQLPTEQDLIDLYETIRIQDRKLEQDVGPAGPRR
jgi:hypothetical protein